MKEKMNALLVKVQMKKMDVQNSINEFVTSEVSAKGTMEEGVNSYGAVVLGVLVLIAAVTAYELIFGNIFDFFQDGTTKRPADWGK